MYEEMLFLVALPKICFQLEINFYFYAFYVYIFLQRDKKKNLAFHPNMSVASLKDRKIFLRLLNIL
jgi:hypothetical protein